MIAHETEHIKFDEPGSFTVPEEQRSGSSQVSKLVPVPMQTFADSVLDTLTDLCRLAR